jgi:hypothetical protein
MPLNHPENGGGHPPPFSFAVTYLSSVTFALSIEDTSKNINVTLACVEFIAEWKI